MSLNDSQAENKERSSSIQSATHKYSKVPHVISSVVAPEQQNPIVDSIQEVPGT